MANSNHTTPKKKVISSVRVRKLQILPVVKSCIDRTGDLHGWLLITALAGRNQLGRPVWRAQCLGESHRGRKKFVLVADNCLESGNTKSCGCMRLRRAGSSRSPECQSWYAMMRRCLNPNSPEYHNYGGRGIKPCERWRGELGSQYILEDLGPKPSKKYSLHRIENDKGYTCGRCKECKANRWKLNAKWVTADEQVMNKRNTIILTYRGRSMNLAQWARFLGVSQSLVAQRLRKGWPIKRVLASNRFGGKAKPITYKGKTQSISAWARELDLNHVTLLQRIRLGWPIHLVLSPGRHNGHSPMPPTEKPAQAATVARKRSGRASPA